MTISRVGEGGGRVLGGEGTGIGGRGVIEVWRKRWADDAAFALELVVGIRVVVVFHSVRRHDGRAQAMVVVGSGWMVEGEVTTMMPSPLADSSDGEGELAVIRNTESIAHTAGTVDEREVMEGVKVLAWRTVRGVRPKPDHRPC